VVRWQKARHAPFGFHARVSIARPANEKADPNPIRFFCSIAVVQVAHALTRLIEDAHGLQRRQRIDRLIFVNRSRWHCNVGAIDGKRGFVMAVHLYKRILELFDYKHLFCRYLGMLGSSVECYEDAVLPKLSYAAS